MMTLEFFPNLHLLSDCCVVLALSMLIYDDMYLDSSLRSEWQLRCQLPLRVALTPCIQIKYRV